MKIALLIFAALIVSALTLWLTVQISKLKKVNPRFPAMLLNVLTCIYLTEIVVVANDLSLLRGWVYSDFVIAVLVWLAYMGSKHIKLKRCQRRKP